MEPQQPNVQFRDVARAIEFMCWAIAVLSLLLRVANGAAVTDDQLAFQVIMFAGTCAGASGLRFYNSFH